jgi:hypothetical protein
MQSVTGAVAIINKLTIAASHMRFPKQHKWVGTCRHGAVGSQGVYIDENE